MSEIEPGTVIDGRYRVLSRIGSGGMADVYLTEDELLSRQVAVKVLQHRFVEDQEFVERFRREASSAAGLSHPNIVAIFDRGTWNGTYYIAMEYLPGRSLKSLVRERGALDPEAAIDIAIQILYAASFAHSRGIVHRDIKPHNVILSDEGRVTVTDFGIARAGVSDMTHTGSIMGTAQYLSPEQAQGHQVSAASDIYAVGVLLYELLTGRVPFEGESAVAIALQHLSAEPPAPSSINPAVPAALDAAVLRALAKDPAQRYTDAHEFIAALEDARSTVAPGAARGRGGPAYAAASAAGAGAALAATTALYTGVGSQGNAEPSAGHAQTALAVAPSADRSATVGPPSEPTSIPPPSSEEPPGEDSRRRRRRRWWWAAAAAVVAAGALVAALELSSSKAEVTVPPVTGQPEAAAVRELRGLGLDPSVSQTPSVSVPAGNVVSQSPQVGTVAQKGTRVFLAVSTGPANVAVPNVVGMSEAHAVALLRARGLDPVAQGQASRNVAAGEVISSSPSAGTVVLQGTSVTVSVSSGPPPAGASVPAVKVPNVTGSSLEGATETLTAAGLAVGSVSRRSSATQAAGTVISQQPGAGSSVAPGAKVNLVVAAAATATAEAPPPAAKNAVTVPNVLGNNETAAAAALGAAGLNPTSTTRSVSNTAENGIVLEETPSAGHKVRRGATVSIVVGALTSQTATTTTSAATETGAAGHP
jgi:eukaryotic-like serine/threonine-protein kinase